MINITIIGIGLIGTSLGMALRSADEKSSPLGPIRITGYDRDQRTTADARGRLAIDRQARSLEEALREAQLVVLAVPAQALRDSFAALAQLLPASAVVTDVASTKAQVVEWAAELLPRTIDFIGGHPMAGKEQSGPHAADPELFRDAVYCLTPPPHASQASLDLVDAMVRQAGAKPYYIDPLEHDAYVAGVSHLPFLLSALLVEATSRSPAWREMAPLAATGFRDVSRLASGDVAMHRDICLTNRAALRRWVDELIGQLAEARDMLDAADAERLEALFAHARQAREEWLSSRPGLRPGEADFESPGGISAERRSILGQWTGRGPRGKK